MSQMLEHMRKLLLVVGLAACSSGSDEPGAAVTANDAGAVVQPVDFVGKWRFVGMSCGGKDLIFSGYQETLEWTDTTFHGETFNSQCKVTFDNPIKVVDGKPKAADTPQVGCSPAACALTYTVSAGAEKVESTKKCPDDFTVVADGTDVFNGNQLTFTVKSGDTTCTAKYTKF